MRPPILRFSLWLASAVPLLMGPVLCGATQVLPQLAYGGGWSTTVYLFNTGSAAGTSTLAFYDDNGNAMAAPAKGGAPVSILSEALAPGAAVSIDFPNAGPLQQGWIALDLAAGVNGYAVFRQSVAGIPDQEAVVPLVATGSLSASFAFDNRGLVTTASVVNPSNVTALVNVVVRSADSSVLGSTQLQLQPKAKTAFILSDLPGLASAAAAHGTVDMVPSSSASVAVLGLRFRGSAFTSVPAYHGPISTSQAPVAIPPPVLQGSALTSSSVRLTWSSTAANRIRYRIEWRGPGGTYTEIAQPSAIATTTDLTGLSPAAMHAFRMRVETSLGLSGYSNEVQIATPAPTVIPAPTGLRLVSANQIEATLAWVNNAPAATGIRLEIKNPGATGFVDIGPGSLAGTKVTGLAAQQTYSFRVRVQTADGYSAYSNELGVTTPPKINVFMLHGIGQDNTGVGELALRLEGQLGNGRFNWNNQFNFSICSISCQAGCTISVGAQGLGQLVRANPVGDIVFIGYSMGGLIARDLIANNWSGSLTGRRVSALITLGSPHLGYPYDKDWDKGYVCDALAKDMDGDFRDPSGSIILSQYLYNLTQSWAGRGYPGTTSVWLAAAGQSCSDKTRPWFWNNNKGCADNAPYSDGVVCSQSATYRVTTLSSAYPTSTWTDPERRYVHTNAGGAWGGLAVLCGNSGDSLLSPPLNNPPANGLLFNRIAEVLSALP